MTAVPLLEHQMKLGESIIWDDRDEVLYWVDVGYPSFLHRFNPATSEHQSVEYPGLLCGVTLTETRDTVLLLMDNSLGLCEFPAGTISHWMTVEPDRPSKICNDCGVDSRGRLWVGTMQNNLRSQPDDEPWRAVGSLYKLQNGEFVRQASALGIPNTMVWSSDQRHFYMADSHDGRIFCFDFDGESLSRQRVFAHSPGAGVPDGSTVDCHDHLWNARWGDAAVFVYSPDGTIAKTIPIPASQVTSCTFGGPDMTTLFVTTARYEMTPAEEKQFPLAGAVFRIETAIRGKTRGRVKL